MHLQLESTALNGLQVIKAVLKELVDILLDNISKIA